MRDVELAVSPAIYYFHPLLAGPLQQWSRHLDRCRDMGFTHVLIAPPFLPGRSGNIFLTADHDRPNPKLAFDGTGIDLVQAIAEQCADRGMTLWLDLVLDRMAAESPLVAENRAWFARTASDALPDPRQTAATNRSAAFHVDAQSRAPIIAWWQDKISEWVEAGIHGFRIERPQTICPELLQGIVQAAHGADPACRFIGWTPGLTATDLAGLDADALDFTVASTCWWDFRADWYFDERMRLEAVAPPLALSEAPFGRRLADSYPSSTLLEEGYRRLIRYCATSGNGWVMPMGFEFASTAPMDAIHADPVAFREQAEKGNVRFISEIAEANASGRDLNHKTPSLKWDRLSAPNANVLGEISTEAPKNGRWLRLVNADHERIETVEPSALLARTGESLGVRAKEQDSTLIQLEPAELLLLEIGPVAPVKLPAPKGQKQALAAAAEPRLFIERISPAVNDGRYPAKRTIGDRIAVEADIFSDGHGSLAADLLWRTADEKDWRRVPMKALGNDCWTADFRPQRIGEHLFTIEAWQDVYGSLQHGLEKKRAAGINVDLEITEMLQLIAAAKPLDANAERDLAALQKRAHGAKGAQKLDLLLAPETAAAVRTLANRTALLRREPAIPLTVDRGKAMFSSWYELFPRSQSGSAQRHGTFEDVIERLPDIAGMGFDTLYFPPIHPIGRANRKGRNNNPKAQDGEPGSPYAIGSKEGGHEAIHPELGTVEDFRRLRDAAEAHGMELALDFAIQCAPDHPWLKQHPGWFAWRPDGSLAYAENPPKKYEDIVNVDFYSKDAVPGLWIALRDIVLYWRMEGVRTFRVDNPHTKPLPFWRWLIADVKRRFPDTLFLSEAFTRPKVMYALAKVGFSQSYTYFTWRNNKAELEAYLTELTQEAPKDFFRPHLFVNTPDINPVFLQRSGRAGFLIRAALATTLSGLWGMYSGFELCEAVPLQPGREEYLDSEKYQVRAWDWDRPGNIKPQITLLNRIRRSNPALQSHLGIKFQVAHNEHITFFSKTSAERDNILLVAINLDPFRIQEAAIEIPLWQWGLPDHATIDVEDLVGGTKFQFHGKHQRVRLDPYDMPFAIWRVTLPTGAA